MGWKGKNSSASPPTPQLYGDVTTKPIGKVTLVLRSSLFLAIFLLLNRKQTVCGCNFTHLTVELCAHPLQGLLLGWYSGAGVIPLSLLFRCKVLAVAQNAETTK